jgi:hypothetical protein
VDRLPHRDAKIQYQQSHGDSEYSIAKRSQALNALARNYVVARRHREEFISCRMSPQKPRSLVMPTLRYGGALPRYLDGALVSRLPSGILANSASMIVGEIR